MSWWPSVQLTHLLCVSAFPVRNIWNTERGQILNDERIAQAERAEAIDSPTWFFWSRRGRSNSLPILEDQHVTAVRWPCGRPRMVR